MNIAPSQMPRTERLRSAANESSSTAALRADRAIAELRRGRVVRIHGDGAACHFAAIEALDDTALTGMVDRKRRLHLVMADDRIRALGLAPSSSIVHVAIAESVSPQAVRCLIGLDVGGIDFTAEGDPATTALARRLRQEHGFDVADMVLTPASRCEAAAFALGKQTRLVPALAVLPMSGLQSDSDSASVVAELPILSNTLQISAADAESYSIERARHLRRVSEACVPLAVHEDCRFIVYRESFGDAEHVAIIIGQADTAGPVPIRLHSSCLTGDLFGSLRCDCGEQLHAAVARIAAAGGGVLLYLSHEGRGIGLANKLRAYQLQRDGLDTLQADRYLGFRADERDYTAACSILDDLGIRRVRLLTNNPGKIAALKAGGIEVVDRTALPATENPHNARYMRAKREHAGHLGIGESGILG